MEMHFLYQSHMCSSEYEVAIQAKNIRIIKATSLLLIAFTLLPNCLIIHLQGSTASSSDERNSQLHVQKSLQPTGGLVVLKLVLYRIVAI